MAKGISRQLIIQAALELLDDVGIDGLTARALAERLGVRAPALYWHISGKQEILDEMGTEISRRVAAAMAAEPATAGWRDGLAAYARVLRAEYLAHKDGARTFSGIRITDPAVLKAQEEWGRRWMASGLTLVQLATATRLVTSFVVGFVLDEQARGRPGPPGAGNDVAADAPLVRATRPHLTGGDERFALHLEIVLTGLATHFAGARSS